MFRFDAFLIFLVIGFLVSLVAKTLVYKIRKWSSHVRQMQKIAGGTFAIDPEANYWLWLIKDRNYRPIWRWHYAKVWEEKHAHKYKNRPHAEHPRLRKAGYAVLALALVTGVVGGISFFGPPIFGPPDISIKTQMSVLGIGNLTVVALNDRYIGNIFGLNGTTTVRMPTNPYPGGIALLLLRLNRTDSAYASATVFLDVTSNSFFNGTASVTYLSLVEYEIYNATTSTIDLFNVTSASTQFGVMLNVPGRGSIEFLMVLHFRAAFDTYYKTTYVQVSSFGSPISSHVAIEGGVYTTRGGGL